MAMEYNPQFHANTIAEARQNAERAYNQGMLQYQNDRLAYEKAAQAWKETMDKAGLTGQYEGQWTMPVQQWQAETFGTWGAPAAGQQTQAAQQQQFAQQQALAGMYGGYYAPGTAPTQGMQTQAAQEQAYTQWLRSTQEARAQQALQQQTANQYLTLLSQLRGPADWAKYQQVLGSTPGGMRDLVGAAMGQYIPGGGATTGVQPQAANLNTLYGDVTGQQNLQALQGGGLSQQAQAATAQPGQPGATPQQPLTTEQQQAQNALGGGTNAMGGANQPQYNLPAPNQVAMQSWNNMAPSQQEMLKGMWESQGWYKPDVEALMNQSLPKYTSNAAGAGTWRLR